MSQHPAEPPTPDEQGEGASLPLIDLETLLNRPPSQRKRLVQIGFMLAALLVVVVTFWDVARPQPSPRLPVYLQPTLPPPTLRILSNVNYGTLTINGQPQPNSSSGAIKMRSQPPYTIMLKAPPFRPISCSYPPPTPQNPYGFLPCVAEGGVTINQQTADTLQVLFTLADLPPDQQQQVTTRIFQAVTAEQTIGAPAQSFIVTGLTSDGTIASQSLPGQLEASAFLVLNTQNSQGGSSCQGFVCMDSGGFVLNDALSGQIWEVATPAALRWRFTDASGQVVSDVTFPSATTLPLYLSYAAATGWQLESPTQAHLSQALTDLICPAGEQILAGELAGTTLGSGGDWNLIVLHDQGVVGCELELAEQGVDQGHFVWRFGVLLAADARAHSVLPALPVTRPSDLAAVEG